MDLRTTQLKDTYGNLVTTGTTEGAPTSGGLQNGQGTLLTSVGIGTNSIAQLTTNTSTLHIHNSITDKPSAIYLTTDGTGATANDGFSIYVDGASENVVLNNRENTYMSFRTNSDEKLRIEADGDIAFYDDANNQGLFWDASTARLGIGTTSPSSELHVAIGGKLTIGAAQNTEENSLLQLGQNALYGIWELKAKTNVGYTPRTRLTLYGQSGGDASDDIITFRTDGNVGIGTTSPATNLHVSGSGTQELRITSSNGNPVLRLDGPSGNISYIQWNSAGSAPLTFYDVTTSSERMRIDSSGNVGIGETNPQAILDLNDGAVSEIRIRGNQTTDLRLGGVAFYNTPGADVVAGLNADRDGADDAGALTFDTQPAGGGLTERMRIDSSGRLLVGTETALAGFSGTAQRACFSATGDTMTVEVGTGTGAYTGIHIDRTSSDGKAISFERGNTDVGSISITTTATAYNTSSDYRLKENVVELTGALDRVAQLKPSRFNFIADADTTVDGFLAHEVADIVPEAISGEKDAVDNEGNPIYQGIDQSKLVPLLVGAIQELRAEIEQLKNQ